MEEITVSITKKAVEAGLLDALFESTKNEGFIRRKSDKVVIRKTKIGYEEYFFRVLTYWPYCAMIDAIIYSVRINAVEDIKVKCGLYSTPKYPTFQDWRTISLELFNENDLEEYISNQIDKIKEDGLSYYAEYVDIKEVNRRTKDIILHPTSEIAYVRYNELDPISTSLILMKLCRDKDFDEMKIKYRKILRSQEAMIAEDFAAYDNLVEYLSKKEI